jgi:Fe-S-cluster-containing hydrogenase component 2
MKPGTVKVLTHARACQGCRACEAICSLKHFGEINPRATGIKIDEKQELGKFQQTICQQCIDMPCAEPCPENAIQRDGFTGAVVILDTCTGCGACVEACPIGAIRMADIANVTRAVKCDFCGGIPECVNICPRQALSW